MTLEQFSTIHLALLSMRINSRVDLLHKELTDYRRAKAEQELKETEEALAALNAAFDASAILRGCAPCPSCGEYIADVAVVAI